MVEILFSEVFEVMAYLGHFREDNEVLQSAEGELNAIVISSVRLTFVGFGSAANETTASLLTSSILIGRHRKRRLRRIQSAAIKEVTMKVNEDPPSAGLIDD